MADRRTESTTERPTIRDSRPAGLVPEDDPTVTRPGLDESPAKRLNESEEGVSQRGRDTSVIDADNSNRGNTGRTATQVRTPPRTTITAAAPSRSREWEKGPNTASDQSNTGSVGIQPLFSEFDINDLRSRWNNVQASFVDSPRQCVQQADELVADVLERLTTGFTEKRASLEKQWDSGGNVSTEDLRVALQRYRSFFGRLLNAA